MCRAKRAPAPLKLGENSRGWLESDIAKFQADAREEVAA
jgi:predicted DNA-binding transcriptional regulator AlpA